MIRDLIYKKKSWSIFMLSLAWVSFVFLRILGEGFPKPPMIVFFLFVAVAFLSLKVVPCRIFKPLFIFLLYTLLGLMLLNPDPIFQSYSRLLYFFLLLLIVSPLIQKNNFRIFRESSFVLALNYSIIIAIISMVCFFLGFNFAIRESEDADTYLDNPNLFSGITNHSMTLGFVSMIAFVYVSHLAISSKKWSFVILAGLCFLTTIMSGSRASILAGLISLIFLLFRSNNTSKMLLKRIIAILTIVFLSFPFWSNFVERVMLKQSTREVSGPFDSRTYKFKARINEFEDSPLLGIGFSVVDPRYERLKKQGTIEPGSSWLGLLSMTGLIGFFIMFYVFVRAWRSVYRKRMYLHESLLLCLYVHMFVEGYIISAGSIQCVILWTVIGACIDSEYDKSKKILVNGIN